MARKISTARKVGRVIKSILKIVLVIILAALMALGNGVLPGYARMVNVMLGYEQSWDNSKTDTTGLDLEYNKADYATDTIKDAEKALDEQLAAEGYVLLKNDGDTMPFASGTTFSFFGESSRSAFSSYDKLNAAFESEGFSVNQTLEDFYSKGAGKDYKLGAGSVSFGDSEDFSINECPLSVVQSSDGVLDSAEGTVPVFVLKRVAGEGRDAPRSMYNHADNAVDQAKTYLEPDTTELETLQYLNDNFDDVVLVVNTSQAMELDWLSQFPNIKSVIYMPSSGTYGVNSLAGIFSGRVNPSGRTVDTFAADTLASPAAQNFGDYQYTDASGNLTKYNYVSYEEGIYVGYRYYETRYEDAVLGQGNAGDFDYDSEVVYPFGYGLSYTSFAWSDYATSWNGSTCTATVTVKNTGDAAGKDVVELYAQSPYTDYDKTNGVEKASVDLVGYAKTSELAPGESETVTITFDESQLAAYDSTGAKTYVLDAGTYYVTAATDSHAAVENILSAKGAAVQGNTSLVNTYVPDNTDTDVTTYAVDSESGETITNLFDDASGDLSYLSRSDWTGTFPTHDGTPTSQVSTWGNEINGSDGVSYTYSKVASDGLIAQLDSTDSGNPTNASTLTDTPVYGAKNGLTLADVRGLSYDDEKWDDLLDELTVADYDVSINRGGYGTEYLESVGKPFGIDADSASGLIYGSDGSLLTGSMMTYCGPMTLAQTFNQELAEDYGEMIGNEAIIGGATGWYAPSMDIHRTPYSGRNGEYYSEDPFLSGTTGSLEVKGAASKGMYATIKHFALNDQEDHRGDRTGQYSIATWANEQSLREIYLKPFEMCMKVGDVDESYVKQNADGSYSNATTSVRACQAIMTGFNRIGATWTGGSYALLTGLVRDEWGFDGWIITDNANTATFMDAGQMIEAGGDTKLTYATDAGNNWTFDSTDSASYHYAREALHHLLYVMANSKAMNGSMPGSVYKPGFQIASKLQLGINVVGVAGIGLVGFTAWRNHKKRQAERAEN